MEPTTAQDVSRLIPRQAPLGADAPAGAAEHWLVRRLHEERRAADSARLHALMAAGQGDRPR